MAQTVFPILTALAAAASASAGPEALRVRGTSVLMEPPSGWSAAEEFPGFGRREELASIMVTSLPVPAHQVREGMTREMLAARGTPLLSEEAVTVDGAPTVLYSVTQSLGGVSFRKWIVVLGRADESVLLVGTFPAAAEATLSAPIRRALLSARLAPEAPDPSEGLPFRVQPSKRLPLATRMSDTLLFTESGRLQGKPEDALLAVGPAFSQVEIGDLPAFARQRAGRTERVRDLSDLSGLSGLSGRALRVDGMAAYELVGRARDQASGAPLSFYQLMMYDGSRYYLAVGLVALSRGHEFLPEFRKVSESLTR